MRSARRASHLATTRFVHPQEPFVSSIRTALIQLVRAHQAEPIPRPEHAAGEGVHRAAIGLFDCSQGGTADSLRLETGEHSSQIVSRHLVTL